MSNNRNGSAQRDNRMMNQHGMSAICGRAFEYRRVCPALMCCLLMSAPLCRSDDQADPYDALHDVIMTRHAENGDSYGKDYHAPLIWFQSSFLLEEPTHSNLVNALDRFNTLSAEQLEDYGDLKRALLQRHLWAVFDWATARRNPASADPEPEELRSARMTIQHNVVRAMKLLALSRARIRALPDPVKAVVESGTYSQNYDPADIYQPFLPIDLFDETGPWVSLRRHRDGLTAPLHSEFEAWRSTFLVFIRLPEGRHATLEYLDQLNRFREPVVIDRRGEMRLHPDTPQFPVGTQFALVERPLLISDQGEPILSPLVYRIELRAYLNLNPGDLNELNQTQAVAEFVLQPRELLAGKPSLKALGRSESHYSTFTTVDPFENEVLPGNHIRLQNCITCHQPPGVRSFASRHRQLQFRQIDRVLPAILKEGNPSDTAWATIDHKKRDYTWGVLEVLWHSATKDDATESPKSSRGSDEF